MRPPLDVALWGLGTAGNLTTDAHLAALAMEHQATLWSTDADFARFPGLKWENPLAGWSAPCEARGTRPELPSTFPDSESAERGKGASRPRRGW